MTQMTEWPKRETTPWGYAQESHHIGGGVLVIATAGHGGLYIPEEMQAHLPAEVREVFFVAGGKWAEEDCDMTIAITFLWDWLDIDALSSYFINERASHWEMWYESSQKIVSGLENYSKIMPQLLSLKMRRTVQSRLFDYDARRSFQNQVMVLADVNRDLTLLSDDAIHILNKVYDVHVQASEEHNHWQNILAWEKEKATGGR